MKHYYGDRLHRIGPHGLYVDRRTFLSAAGLAALGSACGGHSPTGPDPGPTSSPGPVPPVTAQFLNGLNRGEFVDGLTVTVNGVPLAGTTGSDGRSSGAIPNGAGITTRGRSDYLDREMLFSSASPQLPLWHLAGIYDAGYYKALIYDRSWAPSIVTLMRPAGGTYTVSATPELKASSAAMHEIQTGLSEAMRVSAPTDEPIQFSWVDSGGAVSYEVNGSDPAIVGEVGAVNYLKTNGSTITGGRVVFKSLVAAALKGVAVHETGHFMGYGHSSRSEDLMYFSTHGQRAELGPGETSAWVMMAQRKPGNRFPDKDASVTGSANLPREILITCA